MTHYNGFYIGILLCLLLELNQPAYSQTFGTSPHDSLHTLNSTHEDTTELKVPSESISFSPHKVLSRQLIRFYQIFASPARGTVCPMHPTCSRYAYEAFARYNFLRAWLMTTDRLIRCGMDEEQYTKVLVGKWYRWFDGDSNVFDDFHIDVKGGTIGCKASLGIDNAIGISEPTETKNKKIYYGSDSIMYHFAEWLRKRGDYESAIIEYLRLEYSYPLSEYISNARKSVCECYYLSGFYKKAIECSKQLLYPTTNIKDNIDIILLMGASYFRCGNYNDSIEILDTISVKGYSDDIENHTKALMLQGLNAAYMRKWKNAERYFLEVSDGSEFKLQAIHCARVCNLINSSKKKNPTLAGVLAIMPGLGYLYSGYSRTALSAFIINGAFIWGAAEAFKENHSGLGATLSFIGFGWYAGNIYGSITSARRYNGKQVRDLLLKLDIGFKF